MRKERVEGRKAYSSGQEATREHNSGPFLLQPTSSLLSGLMAHVTDRSSFSWLAGHMRLIKSGKARTKLCA